jgi:hypothetical protein
LGVWESNDHGCVVGGCLVLGAEKWISWLPFTMSRKFGDRRLLRAPVHLPNLRKYP